jgi:hypothetical protein
MLHTSLHNEELLTSEDVTDRLSRNVGRELSLHAKKQLRRAQILGDQCIGKDRITTYQN